MIRSSDRLVVAFCGIAFSLAIFSLALPAGIASVIALPALPDFNRIMRNEHVPTPRIAAMAERYEHSLAWDRSSQSLSELSLLYSILWSRSKTDNPEPSYLRNLRDVTSDSLRSRPMQGVVWWRAATAEHDLAGHSTRRVALQTDGSFRPKAKTRR